MKIFIAVIMFATQSVMACQSGVDSNRATVSDVDKTQIGSATDKETTTIESSTDVD